MSVFRSFAFVVLFGLWASTASAVQLFLIDSGRLNEDLKTNLYRVDTDALGTPEFVGKVNFDTDEVLRELVTASPTRLYTFDRDSDTVITISSADATVLSTALSGSRHATPISAGILFVPH